MVSDLTRGLSYTYYFRCVDVLDNESSTLSYNFSFTSSGGGAGNYESSIHSYQLPQVTKIPDNSNSLKVSTATEKSLSSSFSTSTSFKTYFLKSLALGSKGNEVYNLQRTLNDLGFHVSFNGPGSRGKETSYFGPATREALIKFQIDMGVITNRKEPGAGHLGPKSRAKLNSLI